MWLHKISTTKKRGKMKISKREAFKRKAPKVYAPFQLPKQERKVKSFMTIRPWGE